MHEKKKRLADYKWVIVALCFVMVFTCLGFCSGTKSLYLAAITKALGLKRSLFSISDSCRFITTAIVNLFFGTLIAKFGPRKLIGAGFLALIASVLINANADNIIVFYIGGCFLGIGLSWTTTTMVGFVINKWCKEHRGTIMGLVLAANGIGGAVVTQIISPIIYNEANVFGYRDAYRLTALILFLVGATVVIFFRNEPKQAETGPQEEKKKAKKFGWIGISLSTAMRQPYFYIVALCVFLTGMILQGIGGIATAHMNDVGLNAEYVAMVLSAHSLALALFKFLAGVFHDRYGLRKTMLVCNLAAVIALLLLACLTNSAIGSVMAMLYGVLSSVAMPLETIMLPLIAADLFGELAYSQILGLIVSINTAGYAIGAPLLNLVYDVYGTYRPMLLLLVVLMLVITFSFRYALRQSEKLRAALDQV